MSNTFYKYTSLLDKLGYDLVEKGANIKVERVKDPTYSKKVYKELYLLAEEVFNRRLETNSIGIMLLIIYRLCKDSRTYPVIKQGFIRYADRLKDLVSKLNLSAENTYLGVDLNKHVLGGYLDIDDKYSVLKVDKIEEFNIAAMLNVDLRYDNDFALRYASYKGNEDVVKYLVEKKDADIHADDDYAVRLASKGGYLSIVKYLFSKGADISAKFNESLIWASADGHLDVVKYLFSKGADIHEPEVFQEAAENGHLSVVKYLIEKFEEDKDDDDAENEVYNDGFLGACQKGHLPVVKYLIKKGANVDVEDGYAIRLAREGGHEDVVRYLVEKGAIQNEQDYFK